MAHMGLRLCACAAVCLRVPYAWSPVHVAMCSNVPRVHGRVLHVRVVVSGVSLQACPRCSVVSSPVASPSPPPGVARARGCGLARMDGSLGHSFRSGPLPGARCQGGCGQGTLCTSSRLAWHPWPHVGMLLAKPRLHPGVRAWLGCAQRPLSLGGLHVWGEAAWGLRAILRTSVPSVLPRGAGGLRVASGTLSTPTLGRGTSRVPSPVPSVSPPVFVCPLCAQSLATSPLLAQSGSAVPVSACPRGRCE